MAFADQLMSCCAELPGWMDGWIMLQCQLQRVTYRAPRDSPFNNFNQWDQRPEAQAIMIKCLPKRLAFLLAMHALQHVLPLQY